MRRSWHNAWLDTTCGGIPLIIERRELPNEHLHPRIDPPLEAGDPGIGASALIIGAHHPDTTAGLGRRRQPADGRRGLCSSAPQAVRALEAFVRGLFQPTFDWKALLLGLFLVWFGADGCYTAYWSIVNPVALEMMREAKRRRRR